MAARFAGIVDVPIFSAPYDLNISGYQGFDASPRFARNCQAPLFSYQPSAANTNAGTVARVCSVIPNLTTQSESLLNPTQVAGLSGMSQRINWIDGYAWILNELPPQFGTNYRWLAWRFQQGRNAGLQNLSKPPAWFIDRFSPNAGFAQPRIEFTHPVLPGYDFVSGGKAPLLIYTWNNTYNRVYGMVYTDYGWKLRNLFTALPLPGATWLNFISGSPTAICRNEFANSAGFGFNNAGLGNYDGGPGFGNYMFVGKGTKSSPYILNFRTHEYNPDTITQQPPRFAPVGLPAPYSAAFEAATDVQGWQGGFIFTLLMNGAGYTGERQEIIVTDPMLSIFYVLRLVPQNPVAAEALKTTTTSYSAKIDTEGTLWFYNGGSPGFKNAIFYSFAPRLFFNPTLADFDLPAVTMPCYNTCLPGYL